MGKLAAAVSRAAAVSALAAIITLERPAGATDTSTARLYEGEVSIAILLDFLDLNWIFS